MTCQWSEKLTNIGWEKAYRRQGCLKYQSMVISLFQFSELLGLKELGTEEIPQVLCASIPLALYCRKEQHIDDIFHDVFLEKNHIIVYVNGASHILEALDSKVFTCPKGRALFHRMTFEGQNILHSVTLVNDCTAKMLVCFQVAISARCSLPGLSGLS